MQISYPIDGVKEFVNMTEISPLLSKCEVKVCYVGEDPNRNGTVITKEVATKMGRSLPGCPIVGYYNQEKQDFEGHERELVIDDDGVRFVDITRPYGFVPPNAQVWFQKFEENGIVREYLVTECYLWTGVYEESQRIIDEGNNQSMELSKNSLGFWSKDKNTGRKIFIFNETLIEKLCILGEDVEPCFEGAQFKTQFSLEDNKEFQEFKNTMFAMMQEIQETLTKGGSYSTMEDNKVVETPVVEEFEKKEPEQQEEETKQPEDAKQEPEEEEEEKKYNLEDVVEFAELTEQFNELTASFASLQQEYAAAQDSIAQLNEELASYKEFKLVAERKEKQAMIDSFYMLSEQDKADVVANIDTYSLDDIESKLSVICVRNKVNFNLDTEEVSAEPTLTFSLDGAVETVDVPEWIQAVNETAKKL